MCGITGIILTRSDMAVPDLRARLAGMTRALRHRGPDDEGLFLSPDGRVGLGNRRLAIRDLSPAGHMPMGNAAGTLWITYNGEVYNAAELRAELERRGHVFRSTSDTEVVLQGYAFWGPAVVHRLRGMFAFAIWDARLGVPSTERPSAAPSTQHPAPAGRLFIARDRLGIKPLYYAQTGNAFLFASELKALQASGWGSRPLSAAAVVGYLMLGAVPGPHTLYEGVHALEPGCTLSLDLGPTSAPPLPRRYWSLPTETRKNISFEAAVEEVRGLLQEAVRIRLVSDVPLGAFLSGGLDSSSVVGLMRAATSGPIRTCSMVFNEERYNEAPFARQMADAVGSEHHERLISGREVAAELPHILAVMDQPSVDGVNTYFVSKTAREAGLTVALSGLGGDELFGGYPNTFQGVPHMLRSLRVAEALPGGKALARSALRLLPASRPWARVNDALLRPVSPASAYLVRRGLFSPSEVRALVDEDVWREAEQMFDPIRHVSAHGDLGASCSPADDSPASWISRVEMGTYMQDQLLRDTDVMSMAHSLEVRVPLLDHKLVECLLTLPESIRMAGPKPKSLLRRAVGHALPETVRERCGKQGFTFPFDEWLRGPLWGQVEELLRRGRSSAWLKPTAVERLRAACREGQPGLHWSRPWALAVLGFFL